MKSMENKPNFKLNNNIIFYNFSLNCFQEESSNKDIFTWKNKGRKSEPSLWLIAERQ